MNGKTDEWAELATDEPDAHGVGFLDYDYRYGRKRFPPGPSPNAKKRLAARFCQLKTGHCPTGQYLE